MKKFFFWTFVALLLVGISWFGYKWYTSRGIELNTFSLIPSDAIYILETNRPIEAWKQISATQTWSHLQGNAWFASLTSAANSLDSMIKDNDKIFSLVGNRPVLFSTHLVSSVDYDFLIVADLGDAAGIKFIESYLPTLQVKGLTFSNETISGQEVIKMYDKSDKSTMYLCLMERYLIATYTKSLLQKSLSAKEGENISAHPRMPIVSEAVGTKGFARVYLNYAMLQSYLNLYMGSNEYVKYLSDNLNMGAMYMDVKEEYLEMNGPVFLKDSVVSYFSSLTKSGKGPNECVEVCPERTAFYLGLGFKSFSEFYAGMQENLKKDVEDYNAYMENVRKTEKFLNISMQEDFVSWVDDEIALIEMQSAGKGLDNEVALILKAGNIEKAKERLEHIEKMIRRRTPVKFKAVDYQGYRISYLSVKGVFKALLGKFFARYDKPYYTVLNNYVIFSNHPQTLESIIDDYLAKQTLAKSEEYKSFRSKLSDESTVLVYLNTPSVFTSMKNMATPSTRLSMDSNAQFITCFRHIAFQLTSNGQGFDSKLCEQFVLPDTAGKQDEAAVVSDTLDAYFELPYIYVKNPNEKEYKELYSDSVTVHFEVELKYGFKDGTFTEYHPNGEIKLRGKFNKDKRDGTWKAYTQDGELIGKREY